MSIDFYRKLNQVFGYMALGLVFGAAAFIATMEVKDFDLWLHVKTGEFIVNHGYVPDVDVLSASSQGQPWVNHEWLFQVVAYLIKDAWGTDGLIYMQVVLVVLSGLILLFLTYQRSHQLAVIGMMYLFFLLYQSRFTIRPDLFSLFFFSCYIFIMATSLSRVWALPALFIVQVLWTNSHGFFFLGILFVLIGLLSEAVKRHVRLPYDWNNEGRLDDLEYRRLKWALLLVILATFINPLGWKGALYPFGILKAISGDSKIFFENITELARPITLSNLGNMMDHWAYRLMIFLSALSFVFNRRRIDISALFLWLFFLAFSLMAVRNIAFFAFAAYLVTMLNLSNLSLTQMVPFKPVSENFVHLTGTFAKILIIFYVINYATGLSKDGYYDFNRYERKSVFLGVDQRAFPHKAADFLKENKINARLLNDFNSGAYLVGRTYPDVRVYIDGRTELRGPSFFKRYKELWDTGDEKMFNEEMEKYKLTGVFINTAQSAGPEALLKMLSGRKDLKVIYFDYDAVIFLLDIPKNKKSIAEHQIDLAAWKPMELDLKLFGPGLAMPYQNLSRASTLFSMGYTDQAMAEIDAALKVNPSFAKAYKLKARIYAGRKEWDKAFENNRLALVFSSYDETVRMRYVTSLVQIGDLDAAEKEVLKMFELFPGQSYPYLAKAKVLLKKKQYKEAYDIVLQALTLKPVLLEEILSLGDFAKDEKAFDQAEKYYSLVLQKNARDAGACRKLGRLQIEQGAIEKAEEQFKKCEKLKPDDVEIRQALDEIRSKLQGQHR